MLLNRQGCIGWLLVFVVTVICHVTFFFKEEGQKKKQIIPYTQDCLKSMHLGFFTTNPWLFLMAFDFFSLLVFFSKSIF
jgi:hypothetical protein